MKLEREKGEKNNSSDLGILWKYNNNNNNNNNNNACLFCLKPVWQASDLPSQRRTDRCLISWDTQIASPAGKKWRRAGQRLGQEQTFCERHEGSRPRTRREVRLTGATEYICKIRKARAGHRGPECARVHVTCVLKSLLVTTQGSKII